MTKEWWAIPIEELLDILRAGSDGLSSREASRRRDRSRAQAPRRSQLLRMLRLLARQLLNPISLLLLFSVGLSSLLGESTDAYILSVIVLFGAALGFWQEYGASQALDRLLAMVRVEALVLRDKKAIKIPFEYVVPGDILCLTAGAKIPADARLVEARDLFVSEASLTGETYPVEKRPGVLPGEARLAQRSNIVFQGTHVVSGTAQALVYAVGKDTEFQKIAAHLRLRPPQTEFEQGIHRFGVLLFQITLILTSGIFVLNALSHRALLDSFLFALALAIGLTPQLLPAIVSVNLAHGAKLMAQKGVIVRRLAAIENFGSMDVLCADKTGTLTEGKIVLKDFVDSFGESSPKVRYFAALNAHLETGFGNPIDAALRSQCSLDLTQVTKRDEIPYDFIRKRLSVLVEDDGQLLLITKGAATQVLAVCDRMEAVGGKVLELHRGRILKQVEEIQERGYRVLAVAYRVWEGGITVPKEAEQNLVFLGLLVFEDPMKKGIPETLQALQSLGISLKVISGDSFGVVKELGRRLYSEQPSLLRGSDLHLMSDEAIMHLVTKTQLFAEVEPNQKERLILALKKAGHVVGYLGDGINDASALHVADVGISVDDAVDVAKEAADIVLVERDLTVLLEGVRYGRATFANTMKYLCMATSANFGNMFSMAGASLFLSFLPLLPKQILLTNVLTDLPEMMIAGDRVEEAQLAAPQRWNLDAIRKFMLIYGGLSSFFDFLTFGLLLRIVPDNIAQFRTAWFIESVSSAALVVLIIRSPLPLRQSLPSRGLLIASIAAVCFAVLLPWTPLAPYLGFEAPGMQVLLCVFFLLLLYGFCAEIIKRIF